MYSSTQHHAAQFFAANDILGNRGRDMGILSSPPPAHKQQQQQQMPDTAGVGAIGGGYMANPSHSASAAQAGWC